ncbi:MAG: Txe/YoeB family addiction module toxin [Thermodesulfobacteriota bacterium]
MRLIFSTHAWEDYLYWQQTDPRMLRRINVLIKEAMRDPFTGVGKPEPLRHGLAGYWSRRINDEHRLVYRPTAEGLVIVQLRYHY